MATWQELYDMLLDEDLSPEEIVARLNVRPSRLRRLLASKRLAARLKAAESAAAGAAPPAGPSMTRKAAAALAKRKGRPTGPSVEAVMADAERRRRFREQIASHGGAAMARLYQRGR